MANFAQGVVKSADDKHIILQFPGTNYELHLAWTRPASFAPGEQVQGIIRAQARKVWTMASGGNFIQPLFGPPRVIQGRIIAVDGKTLTIHAGTTVQVDLPPDKTALDLKNGDLLPGVIANITLLPGASFEPDSALESQSIVRRDLPE